MVENLTLKEIKPLFYIPWKQHMHIQESVTDNCGNLFLTESSMWWFSIKWSGGFSKQMLGFAHKNPQCVRERASHI